MSRSDALQVDEPSTRLCRSPQSSFASACLRRWTHFRQRSLGVLKCQLRNWRCNLFVMGPHLRIVMASACGFALVMNNEPSHRRWLRGQLSMRQGRVEPVFLLFSSLGRHDLAQTFSVRTPTPGTSDLQPPTDGSCLTGKLIQIEFDSNAENLLCLATAKLAECCIFDVSSSQNGDDRGSLLGGRRSMLCTISEARVHRT